MSENQPYCPVCEEDVPLTREVTYATHNGTEEKPFKICEGCFEGKPDEVIEVSQG